jgi:hypothetical protein
MTRYWVLGLIVAVVAVLFAVLRIRSVTKSLEEEVDIPLWEADHYRQIDFWPELAEERDDTAPAVLSPPEWKAPKSPR